MKVEASDTLVGWVITLVVFLGFLVAVMVTGNWDDNHHQHPVTVEEEKG